MNTIEYYQVCAFNIDINVHRILWQVAEYILSCQENYLIPGLQQPKWLK